VKLTLKIEIIVENCIMFSTVIGQFAYRLRLWPWCGQTMRDSWFVTV